MEEGRGRVNEGVASNYRRDNRGRFILPDDRGQPGVIEGERSYEREWSSRIDSRYVDRRQSREGWEDGNRQFGGGDGSPRPNGRERVNRPDDREKIN